MGTIVRPRRLLRSNSDCVLRNGKKLPALWPAWVAKESTTPVQTSRSSLLDLPEELLLEAILPHMDHRDLFSLSQVCRRLNVLAEAPERWLSLCAQRWGPLTELQLEAAQLASWKRLFRSKVETDHSADQMHKLCSYELEAAVRRIVACCKPAERSTITFLLDGSGSVTSEDFQVMTGFVSTAMEAVMRSHPHTKVAVVQFSNDVRVEVHPRNLPLHELRMRLDHLTRMNGGTNIALSLKQAGQLLREEDPRAARVIILLTDGRVDTFQGREAVKVAERLVDEQANVSIFALGVGRGVECAELERIIAVCGADKVARRYIPLCTLDEAPW